MKLVILQKDIYIIVNNRIDMNGNSNTNINAEFLKSRGIKERDLEMYKMRVVDGKTYAFIATQYKLKSPVTVSRKIKRIQELLRGIENGNVSLENAGVQRSTQVATSRGQSGLALPEKNPFLALNNFQDMAGISAAGGSVIGSGAAALIQGFVREDLPYETRVDYAMKGGASLAGSILSMILTFNKLCPETPINIPTVEVNRND